MAETSARRWTIDEFFAWQEMQADRYELVGGQPLRMMAGARNAHDLIVVNILAGLRPQLRGGGCRPFTGDSAVETFPGQIRRPDLGVDCGQWEPEALVAQRPRLIVEVLSPTTRDFDTFSKLAEYQSIASLEWIVFVEPNFPEVTVWTRDAEAIWNRRIFNDINARIEFPGLATLDLTTIYEGIAFPARPRLISDLGSA